MHFVCVAVCVHAFVFACVCVRGAPISKSTDILITDISAIKNTDTDANTDIAAPLTFLYFIHIDDHLLVVHYIYMFATHPIHGFSA